MQLKKNLENIYNALQDNEELLRLLHYTVDDASESPLDETRPNIHDLDNYHAIVSECIVPSDKRFDLDIERKLNRICVYTGERVPQSPYSPNKGRQIDNNYVSDQRMVFDVYSHLDNDIIDFRLTWICDTLDEIIQNENITDIGELRFDYMLPISKTPDGYAGMRMMYTMPSAQVTNGKKR